ncbi:MAG: hypothetical protein RIQ64_912, partial [Actinomycetota bacterium]
IGTQHLDTHLVELAVPTLLGFFVAEVRTRVPHLPRHRWMVLHERPTYASRLFGTKSDVAISLVDEVVHLFRDDVGGVTEPLKDTEVLEHRQNDLFVPGTFNDRGKRVDQGTPAGGVGGQDVARPRRRLENRHARRLVVGVTSRP